LLTKCHTFSQLLVKIWHGLAPMGQQEPAAWFNITYQNHMKYIQCSGCNWFGFMTVNGIRSGSDLLTKCQTYSQLLLKIWHSYWHQWVSMSQHHDSTSLIRPIWRIFNALEATDLVSWLPMASVLVQICWQSAILSAKNCW
jgi:hypothetical protein